MYGNLLESNQPLLAKEFVEGSDVSLSSSSDPLAAARTAIQESIYGIHVFGRYGVYEFRLVPLVFGESSNGPWFRSSPPMGLANSPLVRVGAWIVPVHYCHAGAVGIRFP